MNKNRRVIISEVNISKGSGSLLKIERKRERRG